MSAREEILREVIALAEELLKDERVPVDRYTFRVSHGISVNDDEAGLAELERIAAVLDAQVTKSGGTDFYVRKQFGLIDYEASYILRQEMADYQAFMATRPKWDAEERRESTQAEARTEEQQ